VHLFEDMADIDDFARNGSRGNHGWAHQQRSSSGTALTSLEIAIR
jgi:hypothetical protein